MASRKLVTLGLSVLGHVVLAAGAALPGGARAGRPGDGAARAGAGPGHRAPRHRATAHPRGAPGFGRRGASGRAPPAASTSGISLPRANAIDAREQGREIDLEAAHAALLARTTALTALLARATPLRDAIAQVFADVRYFGRTGGLMADVLTRAQAALASRWRTSWPRRSSRRARGSARSGGRGPTPRASSGSCSGSGGTIRPGRRI